MLSNIKHGWCDFDIGNEHHVVSYISDVPVDIINCFIKYYMYGAGIAYLDKEGDDFSFLLDLHGAKVITSIDTDGSFEDTFKETFIDCNINELAQELYHDIADYFEEWITNFYLPFEPADEQQYRKDLRNALSQLEVTLQWMKNDKKQKKKEEEEKE